MFFLSCSGLGECWLGERLSPLPPPSSVCLMLNDWRDGRGDASVLLLVGLKRQSESIQSEMKPNEHNQGKTQRALYPLPNPLHFFFYPPDLIKVLYSLIFLLMRSWLVKTAFYIKKEEERKDRKNE